eukprot:1032172-Pyramimonas_sp.AAC.1
MCDENGIHVTKAYRPGSGRKDGQGLWRFMVCSLLFAPRGRRFYDGRRTTRRSATGLRQRPRLVRVGAGEAS